MKGINPTLIIFLYSLFNPTDSFCDIIFKIKKMILNSFFRHYLELAHGKYVFLQFLET